MVRKLLRPGPAIVAVLVATLSGCGGGGGTSLAAEPSPVLIPIVSPSPTPAPVKEQKPKPTPGPSPTGKAPATGKSVLMLAIKDFTFRPMPLQMHVGQTRVVTNLDSAIHTITADDGSFDSGNLEKGQSF